MHSGKAPSLSLPLRRILIPALIASCASAPAFADPAMDWVQKMSDAMRNLNYRGNFVYMHENQLESMEIAHYRDDNGEKEHLLSLNGEAREVIRDDKNLTCIWPSSREVVIDPTRKNSYSPIFIPEDITRLEKFYDMKLMGMDRIADKETMVVHIDPRDQYRYGFMFWINRENGLMLKSSLIDENQREIEQVMFTSLQLFDKNETLVIDSVQNIADDYSLVRYHREGDTMPAKLDSAWQLDDVPGGFWRDSVLMRRIPDSDMFVQQLVYTDGLASLSVFIERQSSDTIEGSMSMGAVNAYIRILADHSITAIGEVPAVTVKRVAEAVTYHGQ
ncbi:MAG: MucB/RseB C-terminal domain-containing protein [Gammaproteobacteria bacterium]|jgi:sigma-E factor negative regulatory protein RseB